MASFDPTVGIIESLLGGDPSGVEVMRSDDGKEYKGYKGAEEEPVATLRVEDGVIIELKIEDDAGNVGAVMTTMLKALCKDADRSNTPLVISTDSMLGGIRPKRVLEFFGFLEARPGFLERRPGAALPYSMFL